jgi:large-conductance mechanosensitive channel
MASPPPTVVIDQLKKFIIDNSIVGAISGIAVGLFFTNLTISLVGDVIIPAFVLFLTTLNIKYFDKVFASRKEHQFNFTNFLKQLISFMFGVMVVFFFVTAAFKYLIGIDGSTQPTAQTPPSKKEPFYSYSL